MKNEMTHSERTEEISEVEARTLAEVDAAGKALGGAMERVLATAKDSIWVSDWDEVEAAAKGLDRAMDRAIDRAMAMAKDSISVSAEFKVMVLATGTATALVLAAVEDFFKERVIKEHLAEFDASDEKQKLREGLLEQLAIAQADVVAWTEAGDEAFDMANGAGVAKAIAAETAENEACDKVIAIKEQLEALERR